MNKVLYFSKSKNLLCEKRTNGNFFVLNGHWEFNLIDKETNTYKMLCIGENKLFVMPDLTKTTRKKFNKEHPNFGY